jgi:hypothetical protein
MRIGCFVLSLAAIPLAAQSVGAVLGITYSLKRR